MLKITVDGSGKIMDEEVTSGFDELKDPSLKAVRQWIYKPYEQNGRAITVRSRVSLFYLVRADPRHCRSAVRHRRQ
jgi:outer membrane biosynthesis protein TonB